MSKAQEEAGPAGRDCGAKVSGDQQVQEDKGPGAIHTVFLYFWAALNIFIKQEKKKEVPGVVVLG